MLNKLITSKAKIKLLTLFLTNPDDRFYYTELHKRLAIHHSLLQRELKLFVEMGLLFTTKEAGIRYYWVNKKFTIYPELKSIIYKTTNLADNLREAVDKIALINIAFICGSVAKNLEDAKSDIDVMIIGDPDMDILTDAVLKAEKMLLREINFTVFDPSEWKQRIAKNDSFVMDVLNNNKIFILGDEDELRRLA
ncbi:hypothetical protein AUK11_02130 [bacterium CG2_30_37_16]|nr:MAG: hypothetical protein AUK11_02130 [bacterium CG2_30_37_16]PIP30927.1 MAG: hypothetical protein COX25_02135 [bacterium (Candidatus Howlettbacteria) CG23_combo_of_CG06-09_8_20_14_all_37_9]PIX99180.1 MAG: hypothetical protein COZ22_03210 [bacterium (Candidatus Howlettbacteria) CG_4_10_14_3_um_filter_37_10]PJB06428.1 MAG: hypothetical protein CO123_02230 [bacterium (Candidatus Howlettbacteria) CG_4_9_14_3_um_filter_37_10]